jgi:hypothetical protein
LARLELLQAELRRDLGLDHVYGTKAVEHGIGEQKPTPGSRPNKQQVRTDPSEPEDDVVIVLMVASGMPSRPPSAPRARITSRS